MIKDIKYFLYQGNKDMERALLEGVLLYNSKSKAKSRKAMLHKAVFSVVLQGNGVYNCAQIASVFREHFQADIPEREIEEILAILKKDGYLDKNGMPVSETNGKDYFASLDEETDRLIKSIISRAEGYLKGSISEIVQAKENIRHALSIYYQMYVFSFFDMKEDVKEDNSTAALDAATKGLDSRIGEALVHSLAYTLQNPTREERRTLEKWAKAHVSMQIIGLDPTLRYLQATKIKGKEFILDTDILIRCLASTNEFHELYLQILEKLKSLQCHLYVLEEVIHEVESHLDAAWNCYQKYGDALLTYSKEMLRSGIKNIFIEDYVSLKTSNLYYKDLSFQQYLRNLYDKRDSAFLRGLLRNLVGERNFNLPFTADVDNNQTEKLYKRILPLTESTFKGVNSTDLRNQEISKVDAYLYLATASRNKGTSGNALLSRKAYLVTRSRRAIKAAMDTGLFQRNIVCHPNALIAILSETGSMEMKDVSIVNLFSNPFLVHVGEEMWAFIKPFLEENVPMVKFSTIERLRTDVDMMLDNRLAGNNSNSFITKEQRQNLGIFYKDELEDFQKERSFLSGKVRQQESLLSEKDDEIRKLRNLLNKERLKKAKSGYSYCQSNRSKKKRKR